MVAKAQALLNKHALVGLAEALRRLVHTVAQEAHRASVDGTRRAQVLHVLLSSEADAQFLHTLEVSEDEFQALKAQQGILVDFGGFPGKVVSLLRKCSAARAEQPPRFAPGSPVRGRAPFCDRFSLRCKQEEICKASCLSTCFNRPRLLVLSLMHASRLFASLRCIKAALLVANSSVHAMGNTGGEVRKIPSTCTAV